MTEQFELTENDRHSSTWLRLEVEYTQRLANLREQNDKPVDEAKTADTRARIAEVKRFLALGQKQKVL